MVPTGNGLKRRKPLKIFGRPPVRTIMKQATTIRAKKTKITLPKLSGEKP